MDAIQGSSVASKDPLGERMKLYEWVSRTSLPPRCYTVVRIDGRAFHSWTRGLERPYDLRMVEAMGETTRLLSEHIAGCILGYTQSDEISLVLQDCSGPNTEAWFGGQVQKICSTAASDRKSVRVPDL